VFWRDFPAVETYTPQMTGKRVLGQLAHVSALRYSYALPGGPKALTATLQQPRTWRSDALAPGRVVRVVRGASWIWEGELLSPAYSDGAGWLIGALGAGCYGDQYLATWSTWTKDSVITDAIARGLRWTSAGLPSSVYLKQQQATGSQNVTAHLNLLCSPGSQTWYVGRRNALRVFPVPTTVTRLLVVTEPQARRAGYVNALLAYYQSSKDGAAKATYATAWATNAASIAKHQRWEQQWDMSGSGQMTGAVAAADAAAALTQYRAATYDGPFTVIYGQYLTTTGVPVDLATEQPGEVARLIVYDGSYGGEITPVASPVFPVGETDYDAVAQTLTITPFGSVRNDMGSLLSSLALGLPAKSAATAGPAPPPGYRL
jgi:hypothetical protein